MEWVYVACGGALGAISRHAVNLAVMNLMGLTLVGTFVANITGSFLLGLLIAFWEPRGDFPTEHRLFLAVGFSARTPPSRPSPSRRRRASSPATSDGRPSTSAGASPSDSLPPSRVWQLVGR